MTAAAETIQVPIMAGEEPVLDPELASGQVSGPGVLTLVIWLLCVLVGVIGVIIPYTQPAPPPKVDVPVQAEILQVELTNDPLPPLAQRPETPATQPPPLAQLLTPPPDAPPLTAVAEPAKVAFAIPVEGPVDVVEPSKATVAVAPVVEAPAAVAPTPSPVRTLTFGQGEGRQPAPEYPLRARREGQEGVVTIRFSVAEDGRVLTAEASSPSPWQSLNEAAVGVVRERWRFSSGPVRLFEVAIRFQLSK